MRGIRRGHQHISVSAAALAAASAASKAMKTAKEKYQYWHGNESVSERKYQLKEMANGERRGVKIAKING
jgi:hypothetical protein